MSFDSGIGFLLRTWPLREADLIVVIYTLEHGNHLTIFARGQ